MINNLVSIVLPVYNQKHFVKESLDSILSQEHSFFELIVLNDGSTDDLESVINSYTDSRIKYFSLEHRGLPRTLNIGLSKAQGEFITWTSADNILLSGMLIRLVNELNQDPNLSAVYSGYYHIDENGKIIGVNRKVPYCYDYRQFLKKPNRDYLITQNCNLGASFLYRASACLKAGEFDPNCEGIEDLDYSIRIAKTGPVKWIDELLYKYRLHTNSMSGRENQGKVSYKSGKNYFWKKVDENNF